MPWPSLFSSMTPSNFSSPSLAPVACAASMKRRFCSSVYLQKQLIYSAFGNIKMLFQVEADCFGPRLSALKMPRSN